MPPRPFFQHIRSSLTGENVVYMLVLGIFLSLVLSPFIGLSLDFVHAFMEGSLDLVSHLILSSRRGGLLVSSVGFAAAVAGAGVLIGILIVSALWGVSKKALSIVLL